MTVPPTLLDDYTERLRDPGTEIAPNDIKDEMPYLLAAAERYTGCRVLELGVRGGRSTSAFLAAVARVGGHVWSVDINQPQVPDRWHSCGYWTFKQANDMDVTPELEGWPASYHALFIDTSHELLHTLGEARRFVPYVATGGVAMFHDTKLTDPDQPGERPYVAQALDLFCAEYSTLAQVLPWRAGVTVPDPVQWKEAGGWRGLGVIERPNG